MKYYWIDKSCEWIAGTPFEHYVWEAQTCARLAAQRLESDTDTDFARVFNIIYKTPKTDTARYHYPDHYFAINRLSKNHQLAMGRRTVYQHVMEKLKDFASDWARTYDRPKADVRIYRDLSRWKDYTVKGYCVDVVNHIFAASSVAAMRQFNCTAFTCTNRMEYDNQEPSERPDFTENNKRVTVDVMPKPIWDNPVKHGHAPSLGHLERGMAANTLRGLRPDGVEIPVLVACNMTHLLAHEFMHCTHYGFDDGPITGDSNASGGWPHVFGMQKHQSWHDAEAFATLLIMAGLAELRPFGKTTGGFTLDRTWDNIAGSNDLKEPPGNSYENDKWNTMDPDNRAAQGMVVWYPDSTR